MRAFKFTFSPSRAVTANNQVDDTEADAHAGIITTVDLGATASLIPNWEETQTTMYSDGHGGIVCGVPAPTDLGATASLIPNWEETQTTMYSDGHGGIVYGGPAPTTIGFVDLSGDTLTLNIIPHIMYSDGHGGIVCGGPELAGTGVYDHFSGLPELLATSSDAVAATVTLVGIAEHA
jgi:hypothetical protein